MKKLRGSLAAKTAAIVLLCALVVGCVLATLGTAYLHERGAYTLSYENAAAQVVESIAINRNYGVGHNCLRGNTRPSYQSSNYRYTVTLPDGTELISTYEGEAVLWDQETEVTPDVTVQATYYYPAPPTPTPVVTPTPWLEDGDVRIEMPDPVEEAEVSIILYSHETGQELRFGSVEESEQWRRENSVLVHGYVLAGLPYADDFSQTLQLFNRLYAWRVALPVLAAAAFLLGVGLFLFLLSAAGRRDESDTITPNFIDRIPLDLFAVLIIAGIIMLFLLAAELWYPGDNLLAWVAFALLMLGAGLLFLLFWMSFATRVKLGSPWQGCLIARLWRGCGRLLRGAWHMLARGLRTLPLLWRWVLILAGVLLAELLFIAGDEGDVLWVLHLLIVCPAILFLVWSMRKLRRGAKELAGGNLNYSVDTRYLFGSLREHAEDLNHIRAGLNAAVEERIKSEHFKSELITNVSHDIKTPLTSIVNYVDLLEKENLHNETAQEYVAVLARQSAKLKKLIDDLIEASKASTGVLSVRAERCELGVLLDQCAGEYGERLRGASLELVVTKPEAPVAILADGRHMWRVLDNLLSNVLKYALPGTRVYLSLAREGNKALITLRNISRDPLNLSGEALLERFVRGDSSRNTEGSGLGLAIANSLVQLQGGELDLAVDGDLFKVILRFDVTE